MLEPRPGIAAESPQPRWVCVLARGLAVDSPTRQGAAKKIIQQLSGTLLPYPRVGSEKLLRLKRGKNREI
jgi:hypothetical protein